MELKLGNIKKENQKSNQEHLSSLKSQNFINNFNEIREKERSIDPDTWHLKSISKNDIPKNDCLFYAFENDILELQNPGGKQKLNDDLSKIPQNSILTKNNDPIHKNIIFPLDFEEEEMEGKPEWKQYFDKHLRKLNEEISNSVLEKISRNAKSTMENEILAKLKSKIFWEKFHENDIDKEEPNQLLKKKRKYKTKKKEAKQEAIEGWLKIKGLPNMTLKGYCREKEINYHSMMR